MKFFFALTAALLLGGGVALADGMVTVHVANARSGKPVVGQTVHLTDAAGDFVATTDKLGNAIFMNVPAGRSSVDATAGPYASRCQPYFTVSSYQHRVVRLDVDPVPANANVTAGPLCPLSSLVNPGEGADVYNIF